MPIASSSATTPAAPPAGAVTLREHQRVLELYTEAFAARRMELRSTDELPEARPARSRHLPTASARCIFVPDAISDFATRRDNFAVFKVDILHQLGYWECGTFGLDFAAFLSRFPDPDLARRLFRTFEGGRIDAHLARSYRGLAADLRRMSDHALASRPSPLDLAPAAALLEAQVQLSLGGDVAPRLLPGLEDELAALAGWIGRLATEGATVADTAAAVAATVPLFADLERERAPLRVRTTGAEGEAGPAESADVRPAGGGEPEGDGGADNMRVEPVAFRGELRPDLVQKELELEGLVSLRDEETPRAGAPVPPEVLRQLLEQGRVEITGVENAELATSSGLTVTDLPGSAAAERRLLDPDALEERIRELRLELEEELGDTRHRPDVYFYDEWDHERNGYRPAWCRLLETVLEEEGTEELEEARRLQAKLFAQVRRQFEMLRPDTYRRIKRLTDGDDVDLDAAVEALTDLRARISPSDQVYERRNRRERDVAAAFLLDMSASTDSEVALDEPEPPAAPPPDYDYVGVLDDDPFWSRGAGFRPPRRRRVIDVEKEALVLMAEALDTLGDDYAVYGFSGYGRDNVDFFIAKDFDETFDRRSLGRIAAIKPKRSTRMGPAIRHAIRKLENQEARIRVLLILSDGYPQDYDYGRDRTSREYGMRDTTMALREAELRGIHTYCITVDPAGHDYLREMCPERQYLVIDDIAALPSELPKVYQGLTT
ncbi:MAG: hypothetical protein R3190_10680 [Thermoanaerobaculia bacterium]|nr:hypothetical protein [Thermoanaerobaculia bacterium]